MGWKCPLSGERPWGARGQASSRKGRVCPGLALGVPELGRKESRAQPATSGFPAFLGPPLYLCAVRTGPGLWKALQLCSLPGGGDGRGVGWGGLK